MRIMGIDSDGSFGFALYDTDKPPSAIESGSLNLTGDILDKLIEIRVRFVPIVKELRPDFAGIEAPSKFLRKYPVEQKPDKNDLMSPLEHAKATAEGKSTVVWREQSTVAIAITSQIAGAATALLLCWNVRCIQIEPRSWQSLIPGHIKNQFSGEGAPKKRAKVYCDSLRIQSPNQSSRDACLIALWTAGRSQELKLLERTR